MDEDLEMRLIDLESRLAHQERMAEDLSAVMAEQGRLLDALTAQLRRMTDRLQDLEDDRYRAPDDKLPPHY